MEAIARCVGLDADHLCQACITGNYPTAAGARLYQLALRPDASASRTYDTSSNGSGHQAVKALS